MNKKDKFEALVCRTRAIVDSGGSSRIKLEHICELFRDSLPGYDWVGFYLIDPSAKDELVLGPYVGAPTDHVRIPFGKGICGRAASELKTIVVGDVCAESNYLSCSVDVKSEIVVPIFKNKKLIGEIDIDSHVVNSFDNEDKGFLERVAEITMDLVEDLVKES